MLAALGIEMRNLFFASMLLVAGCRQTPIEDKPAPRIEAPAASATTPAVEAGVLGVDVLDASAPRPGSTRVTLRIVSRQSISGPRAITMKSTITIGTDGPDGTATIGPFEWPCWATVEHDDLQCTFGASYEQARVEKKGTRCTVVADFFGEHTGEKKNVRTFGSVPCSGALDVKVEQAPGLPGITH